MKQQKLYNAAIYMRLSKDDEQAGGSLSISTQKEMLTEYAGKNGWRIAGYYADDGISGTTFEREGFKEMIADIEEGKIDMVITKDLSRLGRDYLKTGFYTECWFPENGVRYIAVNDGIDTITSDNDIAPFKNILNEMYAKDISKKIKSAYKVKIKRGDYHGAFAPFGYAKDPEHKGKLIIDPESSKIVKLIFSLAEKGYGAMRIRTELARLKRPTPSAYLHQKDPKYYSKLYDGESPAIPYAWSLNMICRILANELYIGNIIHYKEIAVSYKDKRRQIQPRDKWLRTENTHEAIIERETWDLIRERYGHKGSFVRTNPPSIFERVVWCADCNRAMWLSDYTKDRRTGKKTDKRYFSCGTNRNYGKLKCSMHCTSYNDLYRYVLANIMHYAKLAADEPKRLLEMINNGAGIMRANEEDNLQSEKKETEIRLADVKMLLKQIYEDSILGKLTSGNADEMMADYQKEMEGLSEKLTGLNRDIVKIDGQSSGCSKWIKLISGYAGISELDTETISSLFEKILIHQAEKKNGHRYQKIELHYRHVGKVPPHDGKEESALIGSRHNYKT